MKVSMYTCVKNGIHLDYHVVEMLKHHLDFADEIVVNDGFSDDGTYEAITAIDDRIKVFRSDWGIPSDQSWFARCKDDARRRCTGDWCILLDADEFIPEWEFERIRKQLEFTDKHIFRLKWINFYGNYKVYHANPGKVTWSEYKHRSTGTSTRWKSGVTVPMCV